MNHLAALLNVITDIDIPTKLSHEIFESYLGQFFQLVGDKDDMKVSDQDFEHMQEIAFALGISEKEFEKIMTEEEEEQKEETKEKDKKKNKKEEEQNDELPEAHDDIYEKPEEEANETDMTNHINRWFGGDNNRNNTNFLF
jgi:hypothetical protein